MSEPHFTAVVKNVPIDGLRMFKALTETGSISKTAQIINRSQPAVSLQLKNLENLLKCTLIHREKGLFNLTRNGQILKDYAVEMLRLNDNLIFQLQNQSDQKPIRIGIPNDFTNMLWKNISKSFKQQFPNTNIEVYEDLSVNLIKMLHENSINLALTLLPKTGGQYAIHSVKRNVAWVGDIKLTRLDTIPVIACFPGCSYRNSMEKSLNEAGIKYNMTMTTNNFNTIIDSVAKAEGVSAILEKIPLETFGLQQITKSILPPLDPLYFSLHSRQGDARPETTALKTIIKDYMSA